METLYAQGQKLVALSAGIHKDLTNAAKELKQAQAYLIQDWSKFNAQDFLGCEIGNFEGFLGEFTEGEDMFINDTIKIWKDKTVYEYSLVGEFLGVNFVDNE